MKLSLVVVKDKTVVESALLCWSPKLYKPILPKREPERLKKVGGRVWRIGVANRDSFVRFANDKLEDHENTMGLNMQECFGYFGTVGIASRYIEDRAVDWVLYLGKNELEQGDILA